MFDNKTARDIGYNDNKDVVIKRINGIHIEKFRTLSDKYIPLGANITLISGKNGTMKTSILGLIAHPFSSKNNAKDIFGEELKTPHSKVFRLSLDKDIDEYLYYLHVSTIKDEEFYEPVRMYPRRKEKRHRVTVGKTNDKGLGNFNLNTSYINFKRLYPMIDTNATDELEDINVSMDMAEFINDGYMKILNKDVYSNAVPVAEIKRRAKSTFGPNKDKEYDYNSISSGEDNLGHILSRMHAFQSNKHGDNKNQLNGIFCIDEIEAGLHPVAQENLFEFIFKWSKEHNIQVVATTHSLYMIQYALLKREKIKKSNYRIQINMISTAYVSNNNYSIIPNPNYSEAYKELTFKTIKELKEVYKINILCEDDMAKHYIQRIIRSKEINNCLNYIYGITNEDNNQGNSWKSLKSIIVNGAELIRDSIVVFDADVPENEIKSNKVKFLFLPSFNELPIEKEIIKYIYDLNSDNMFFKKFNKERESFLSEFYNNDLTMLDDIERIKSCKTKCFKNWAKDDKNFRKYITHYANQNFEYIKTFRRNIIARINEILMGKSLPTFENEK